MLYKWTHIIGVDTRAFHSWLFQSLYRTVYDLAKTNEGIILLEQETNTLNIIFYLSRNPRVSMNDPCQNSVSFK